MGERNNNDLFFTCSLIEYIGREKKRTRREVTDCLGKNTIKRMYEFTDVFHCEPIEKTAYELIEKCKIEDGSTTTLLSANIRYRITGILERYTNV